MHSNNKNKQNPYFQNEESKQNPQNKNDRKDNKKFDTEADKKLLEQNINFNNYSKFIELAIALNESIKKFNGKNMNAVKKTLVSFVKAQLASGGDQGLMVLPKDESMSFEDYFTSSLVKALISLGPEECHLNKSYNWLNIYYDILGKGKFKAFKTVIVQSDSVFLQAIKHYISLN